MPGRGPLPPDTRIGIASWFDEGILPMLKGMELGNRDEPYKWPRPELTICRWMVRSTEGSPGPPGTNSDHIWHRIDSDTTSAYISCAKKRCYSIILSTATSSAVERETRLRVVVSKRIGSPCRSRRSTHLGEAKFGTRRL